LKWKIAVAEGTASDAPQSSEPDIVAFGVAVEAQITDDINRPGESDSGKGTAFVLLVSLSRDDWHQYVSRDRIVSDELEDTLPAMSTVAARSHIVPVGSTARLRVA
jgi:hypothetical protein